MKSCKRGNKKLVKSQKTKKVNYGGYHTSNNNTKTKYLTLQYKSGAPNNNDSKSVSIILTDKTITKLKTLKTNLHNEMNRIRDIYKSGNAYTYGVQHTIDDDFKDVQSKYRACVELLQQINNQNNKQNNNSTLKYIFYDIKLYEQFKIALQ